MVVKNKKYRLSKVAKELGVGISTIIDYLQEIDIKIANNPNTKIEDDIHEILKKNFLEDYHIKEKVKKIPSQQTDILEGVDKIKLIKSKQDATAKKENNISTKVKDTSKINLKVVSKLDNFQEIMEKSRPITKTTKSFKKKEKKDSRETLQEKKKEVKEEEKQIVAEGKKPATPLQEKTKTPKILGKIDLTPPKTTIAKKPHKTKRKRIKKAKVEITNFEDKNVKIPKFKRRKISKKISQEEVDQQIKETFSSLIKTKSKTVKHRKEKKTQISQKMEEEAIKEEIQKSVLQLTEFVTVNELAKMMDVSVNDIISTCMNLGLFVSINQRLDAEIITLVASEFKYEVKFVDSSILENVISSEKDTEENLKPRPPIVTVMGHVDHGKTSFLDYIRKTNVIAGEEGGITQHIGAYHVKLDKNKSITFLDTPGHEAFTAMRARGAQVTDIVIIIIAADDSVMPQTVEAINHASSAGVPIIFAINKIDKPGVDIDKIKTELANRNYLVEDWGGKFQCQEISAKNGTNIDKLLEKVLLEAEMLELKANPDKKAIGSILDSSLDKGRGFVSTLLVQEGTLQLGDFLLSGVHTGNIKAMYNERNQKIKKIGPSEPAIILGLNGAPQAGDKFNVIKAEKEARQIANKRKQLLREQNLRTQKHITLSEIGRRITVGNFKELNIIIKGDVDGSIEALSDSLIKLTTEQIQINIIHKGVGEISESDVMLATASDAIIIGFQVRPSFKARNLAEKEKIDVRLYSIIYDAIEEVKAAIGGMLTPEIKEKVLGTAEVLNIFKITNVGTVAGCIVRDGKLDKHAKIRLIRDGIVTYTGDLDSLKRFKESVKEVSKGYECGLNIKNYNDIKTGDMLEAYQEVEAK